MRLNHAEITSITPTLPPSLEMAVVMDVTNPNSYDVAVRAVRGQVWMVDKYPLTVDFHAPPDGFWMAAGKTTQLRVLLLMPIGLALQIVQEALYTPQIAYRFIGKADVTGTRTFHVEQGDDARAAHGRDPELARPALMATKITKESLFVKALELGFCGTRTRSPTTWT